MTEQANSKPIYPFVDTDDKYKAIDVYREIFDDLVGQIKDYNNRGLVDDRLVVYAESQRRSMGQDAIKVLFENRGSMRIVYWEMLQLCDRILDNPYYPADLRDRCSYFKLSIEPCLSSLE